MSSLVWRPRLHLAAYSGSVSDPNGLNQFGGTPLADRYAPTYPPYADSPMAGDIRDRDRQRAFLGRIMPDCEGDRDGSLRQGSDASFVNTAPETVTGAAPIQRLANQTLIKSYNGINLGPKTVVMAPIRPTALLPCSRPQGVEAEQEAPYAARGRKDSRGSILCYDSVTASAGLCRGLPRIWRTSPSALHVGSVPDRIVLGGARVPWDLPRCESETILRGLPARTSVPQATSP